MIFHTADVDGASTTDDFTLQFEDVSGILCDAGCIKLLDNNRQTSYFQASFIKQYLWSILNFLKISFSSEKSDQLLYNI